jgi:hypothetical protein
MNKVNMLIPEGVIQLVQAVQTALGSDYQVVLSGGYLRDTFGGAPIKDIDIMISPVAGTIISDNVTADVYGLVQAACMMDWFCPHKLLIADYMEGMSERGLDGLLMGKSPNLEIDTQLIVYGQPMTPEAVAYDMDMNICQIVMTPDGEVQATNAFLNGFRDESIKVLRGQSDKREEERVQRMLKKYPHFHVE